MKKISISIICFMFLLLLLTQTTVNANKTLGLSGTVYNQFKGSPYYSMTVFDSKTGDVLYSSQKDVAVSPASGLKLLTGAAALATLGADYTFKTKLYYDGVITNGVLDGSLYLQGSGDPTLLYKDLQSFAWYLKYIGIKQINGYIYGDESRFSGSALSPGAMPKEQYESYAASTPAITLSPNTSYDAGSIYIVVKGGKIGATPTISGDPSLGDVTISNKAKTVAKGKKNTLSVTRKSGSNQIVVSGNIPVNVTTKKLIAVNNPKYTTLTMFVEAMKTSNIQFKQPYLLATKKVPDNAKLILTKTSMTLGELYPHFMKLSNNQVADILVKTMGYEINGVGDLETGLQVIRDYGTSIGLDMSKWTLVDGSGLSAKNKVSSYQLALLMKLVQDDRNFKTFYDGLIIGGHPDKFHAGSLYNRFTNSLTRYKVVGKTGYISGTHSLTGYATGNKTGKTYIFSILTGNSVGSKENIDKIISELILRY